MYAQCEKQDRHQAFTRHYCGGPVNPTHGCTKEIYWLATHVMGMNIHLHGIGTHVMGMDTHVTALPGKDYRWDYICMVSPCFWEASTRQSTHLKQT